MLSILRNWLSTSFYNQSFDSWNHANCCCKDTELNLKILILKIKSQTSIYICDSIFLTFAIDTVSVTLHDIGSEACTSWFNWSLNQIQKNQESYLKYYLKLHQIDFATTTYAH